MASYQDNWDRAILLNEISKSPRNPDGGISAIESRLSNPLVSLINFDCGISDPEKISIVVLALRKITTPNVSPEQLIAQINLVEAEYLQRPCQIYKIATSISINKDIGKFHINCRGAAIRISDRLPRTLSRSRLMISQNCHNWIDYEEEKDYSALIIEIKARSISEAMEVGTGKINYLRGVLNFYLNPFFSVGHSLGLNFEPINKIRLGRIHTLHLANGQPAVLNSFWYEIEPPSRNPPYSDSKVIGQVFEHLRTTEKKLAKSKFGSVIEEGFKRYCDALDTSDRHSSYLKLWSVAEYLTDSARLKYDVTIDRISSIFTDRKYSKLMLHYLRVVRNKCTHAGYSTDRITHILSDLQWYVVQLLLFMIWNSREFDSFKDFVTFLDMPIDTTELIRRLRLTKKSIKFRKHSSPDNLIKKPLKYS